MNSDAICCVQTLQMKEFLESISRYLVFQLWMNTRIHSYHVLTLNRVGADIVWVGIHDVSAQKLVNKSGVIQPLISTRSVILHTSSVTWTVILPETFIMLCYVNVMLCYVNVMLCYVNVMLCYVYVMLCYVMLFYVMLMLCYVMLILC